MLAIILNNRRAGGDASVAAGDTVTSASCGAFTLGLVQNGFALRATNAAGDSPAPTPPPAHGCSWKSRRALVGLMRTAILVFDVGAATCKTFLFDEEGATLSSFETTVGAPYESDGMVYHDAVSWRDALIDGARRGADFAAEHSLTVAGVSVTASRSIVIPVDAEGEAIAPAMMWQETASRPIVDELNHGDTLYMIYHKTGSRPNTVFSAPKMAWLRRNKLEIYRSAHKLVGVQDYLIRFMTGRLVTDHTFGSRTLLMNIRTRDWDDDMLSLFGVSKDKLCPLIPPGTIAGRLGRGAADAMRLSEGLPVITAGGDQQNVMLGAGVVRPGEAMLNLGTASFLVAMVSRPINDPEMRVMSHASAIPGKWILDAGMLATGSVHRWFVDNFYRDIPDLERRYAVAEAEAAETPPGAERLLVLSHFNGCGAPFWNSRARGVFYGLTLRHDRRHMSRAVIEGIAGEIAPNLEVADDLIGGIKTCYLSGGLSKSRFFGQVLTNVCQRCFSLSSVREPAARGAWCQAMVALDLAQDRADALSRGMPAEREQFIPETELAELYNAFIGDRIKLYQGLAALRAAEPNPAPFMTIS